MLQFCTAAAALPEEEQRDGEGDVGEVCCVEGRGARGGGGEGGGGERSSELCCGGS